MIHDDVKILRVKISFICDTGHRVLTFEISKFEVVMFIKVVNYDISIMC